MDTASATGLLSGVFALSSLLLLRPLAVRVRLLDFPDHRKRHKGVVPLIGGLSVFIGLLAAWLISMPVSEGYGTYLLCSLLLVAMGVIDDVFDIPASFRLCVQVALATVLTYGSGISLGSLGNLFGYGQIHLSWLGPVVTIVAYVGVTNAFNMIDGIDGLAGSLSLLALLSLACLFASDANADTELALSVGLAVALVPFLMANLGVPPFRQKIFLGDAGAMFMGFSIVWLFVNGVQTEQQAFRPVTALWIIALPLMDMAAILVCRLQHGRPVMRPDRGHLHHLALCAGFSERKSLSLMVCVAVFLVFSGIAGELVKIPEWVMFTIFAVLFAAYYWALRCSWRVFLTRHGVVKHTTMHRRS